MKLVHILAGVSALAFAAPAFAAAPPINSAGGSSVTITASSNSASNGDASTTSSAQFNLSASVAEDCSIFTGGGAVDVSFGTLGIFNTSTQGLANAFEMTGPASRTVTTNVAGCNTPNTLTVTKSAASLALSTPVAFDSTTFQNSLPYTVSAAYTAVSNAAPGGVAGSSQTLAVGAGATQNQATHGAWKSGLAMTFTIPTADLALVAGTYTGSVTVTLSALGPAV